MSFLDEMLPETAEAFGQLRNSIFKDSFLDVKTKELIAIASSVLMRCQFCVDTHSQRAIAAGATKEEIAEAISVVMFIAAGSQIGWTNIYTENIYDKIFNKADEKETGKEAAKDDICGCGCGCKE
jgi:AhpD family alkylhydroperoxidase